MKHIDLARRRPCAALVLPMVAPAAEAFPEPCKPIGFAVPYPPGGPTDLIARILLPGLQKRLGATALVENRAGGNLGTDAVSKSAPDGHTLVAASGPMAVNGSLYKVLPCKGRVVRETGAVAE